MGRAVGDSLFLSLSLSLAWFLSLTAMLSLFFSLSLSLSHSSCCSFILLAVLSFSLSCSLSFCFSLMLFFSVTHSLPPPVCSSLSYDFSLCRSLSHALFHRHTLSCSLSLLPSPSRSPSLLYQSGITGVLCICSSWTSRPLFAIQTDQAALSFPNRPPRSPPSWHRSPMPRLPSSADTHARILIIGRLCWVNGPHWDH